LGFKIIQVRKNGEYKVKIYPQKEKADIIIRYYTNTQFDYDKYRPEIECPVLLKIGIKSSYNLNKIYEFDEIQDIEYLENYIYINFKIFENYGNIIKKTIKEIIIY
jgi:hypothetical protein